MGEVRSAPRHEPAGERAQHDVGVQHRAVRRRDGEAHRVSFREAARVDRRRPRSSDLASADAARGGARGHPLALGEGPGRVPARRAGQGHVRGVGEAHARGGRGRVRWSATYVSRARRAREPSRPPPSRSRRRPGSSRRHLHDEVAGSRDGSPRRRQGRGRICPARPDVSRRSHRVHARGLATRRHRHRARSHATYRRARRRRVVLRVGRARPRVGGPASDCGVAR